LSLYIKYDLKITQFVFIVIHLYFPPVFCKTLDIIPFEDMTLPELMIHDLHYYS